MLRFVYLENVKQPKTSVRRWRRFTQYPPSGSFPRRAMSGSVCAGNAQWFKRFLFVRLALGAGLDAFIGNLGILCSEAKM